MNTMVKRTMKLSIKGRFKKYWSTFLINHRFRRIGVDVKEVKHRTPEHIEMLVSGPKPRLWDVVKWTRNQNLFFILTEVAFEFVE